MLCIKNVKKCSIKLSVEANDQLIQKEDIKSISVGVSLADNQIETDACVSMLVPKNLSFSVEGDVITIDFDVNIMSSRFTHYEYLEETYAFAYIDIESEKEINLPDYANITYICGDAEETEELFILKEYEAVDPEEEEDYDEDED